MRTTKKILIGLCTLLVSVCTLFGGLSIVGISGKKVSAAGTEVTVSGEALTIATFLPDNKDWNARVTLDIEGDDWANANQNTGLQGNANAEGLGTFANMTYDTGTSKTYAALDVYLNLFSGNAGIMVLGAYNATEITFAKGTKFPSYAYASNGEGDVYVLSDKVTFTRETADPTAPWTRTVVPTMTEVSVTGAQITVNNSGAIANRVALSIDGSDWANANGNTELQSNANAEGLGTFANMTYNTGTANTYAGLDVYFNLYGQDSGAMTLMIVNATKIVFAAGTKFPSYAYASTGIGAIYVLSEKVTFTRESTDATVWTRTVGVIVTEVPVSGAQLTIANSAAIPERIALSISGSDWANANGNTRLQENVNAIGLGTFTNMTYDTGTANTYAGLDVYFNLYSQDSGAMTLNTSSATEITFAAGTKFPSYAYASTGEGDVYVLSDEVTFMRTDADSTDWAIIAETPVDVTVSENKDYRTAYNISYITLSLGGKNLLPKDGGAAYYVNEAAAKNGVDLAEYIYINDVSVRSVIAANAAGTTSYAHSNTDLFPMNVGGQYAPILVRVESTYIVLRIMQEYADFTSFSLTIKPFTWKNSSKEILAVREETTFVYAGDNLVNENAVTELTGSVYNAGSLADPWNANGSYEMVKFAFADIRFSDTIRSLSPFAPIDNANYQYLQDFVLLNGESVKTINARGGYTAPDEFPANATDEDGNPIQTYKVPVHLCLMTDATGWEEDGIYLRIQKEYYNSLTELKIELGAGLAIADGDTHYVLSESYQYMVFGLEVTVTVQDYNGNLLQTLSYIKNDTVVLPDISDANSVLIGWMIGGELCKPTTAITIEGDMTVKAVIAKFAMKDGASIRAQGQSGIRFAYEFDETDWNTYQSYVVESGIMLLPTDTLYGKEFVMEKFKPGETIIVSRGDEKQTVNADGNYEYILRLVNLYEKNYARAFSARGYLKVTYADGSQGYVYTKYSETNNSRSIMKVAQLCKDSGDYNSFSEAEKAVIDNYITVGEANLPKDYVIDVTELTVQNILDAYETAVGLTTELAGYDDIVINLPSGTLALTDTITFAALTSAHDKNIRFVGNNTVISGGQSFTGGWSEYGNGIYSLNVGMQYAGVRQLYVNGVPATLARTAQTTGTWDTANNQLIVAQSALGSLTDGTMEVSTLERWAQSYGVISSVKTSGDNYAFTFADASKYVYFEVEHGYADENSALFLQNSLQFLDAENEYYYDGTTGMLYYKPAADQDINSLTFTLPVVETLLSTKNMVSGVVFENIEFAYSNYAAPSTYGYLEQQANVYSSYAEGHSWKVLPKMITVQSDNVTFTDCIIHGTGAGGIGVERGASNVTIESNRFEYMAGTAIFVGDHIDDNTNLPTNIAITNNLVSSYGMTYGGAAGITVTYADTVTVSHNTVQNGYYSGISLGWGWSINANVQHRNYTVTYNRILNAMAGTLYDGGGIYLLGNFIAETANVVANNYVEISGTCLAAIYLDEGTSDYKVYDNALKVSNAEKGCIFLHNKVNATTKVGLKNIQVYGNYSNYKNCTAKYSRNGVGPIWESMYNSNNNVSYENATVSSSTHINESIYANSGSTLG